MRRNNLFQHLFLGPLRNNKTCFFGCFLFNRPPPRNNFASPTIQHREAIELYDVLHDLLIFSKAQAPWSYTTPLPICSSRLNQTRMKWSLHNASQHGIIFHQPWIFLENKLSADFPDLKKATKIGGPCKSGRGRQSDQMPRCWIIVPIQTLPRFVSRGGFSRYPLKRGTKILSFFGRGKYPKPNS